MRIISINLYKRKGEDFEQVHELQQIHPVFVKGGRGNQKTNLFGWGGYKRCDKYGFLIFLKKLYQDKFSDGFLSLFYILKIG